MTPEAALPAVPLTVEGASVLHQMMRVRWSAWRALSATAQMEALDEAARALAPMETPSDGRQSAVFSLLGHKGDLMFVHFRRSFEELNLVERDLSLLRIADYLEPVHSYLSVVELGLYESTSKTYAALAERGIEPHSEEWNREIEEVLARQRAAMASRLWPEVPPAKYICFYPMDRRRGEHSNWYTVPMAERQRMMQLHGMIGRRYAGEVRQIITGSIGFDDWEWGVDLFAEDPLVFQEADLRNALRRSERRVRALRIVLRGRTRAGGRLRQSAGLVASSVAHAPSLAGVY
jgi:peroxiredoxin